MPGQKKTSSPSDAELSSGTLHLIARLKALHFVVAACLSLIQTQRRRRFA
jgi:hypothetical protein